MGAGVWGRPKQCLTHDHAHLVDSLKDAEMSAAGKAQQVSAWSCVCRTRHNVALIGPRGVGKRAIVEGLAQQIAGGRVPGPLAGLRVIEVQLPALLAGVSALSELDARFGQILLEARGPGIVP